MNSIPEVEPKDQLPGTKLNQQIPEQSPNTLTANKIPAAASKPTMSEPKQISESKQISEPKLDLKHQIPDPNSGSKSKAQGATPKSMSNDENFSQNAVKAAPKQAEVPSKIAKKTDTPTNFSQNQSASQSKTTPKPNKTTPSVVQENSPEPSKKSPKSSSAYASQNTDHNIAEDTADGNCPVKRFQLLSMVFSFLSMIFQNLGLKLCM